MEKSSTFLVHVRSVKNVLRIFSRVFAVTADSVLTKLAKCMSRLVLLKYATDIS